MLGAAEYRGRPSPVFKARLDHGLALYQSKMAPVLITTGGAGGDPDFTEGGVGRSYLIAQGVPSEAIIVEPEGETTAHSIAAAGEILERMGLKSCILVSDGYHIFRAKKMLEYRGIQVYGSPRQGSSARSGPMVAILPAVSRLPSLGARAFRLELRKVSGSVFQQYFKVMLVQLGVWSI